MYILGDIPFCHTHKYVCIHIQVANEIFSSASCFFEKAMADADVWFKNLHPDEKERYRWSKDEVNSHAARESSLFHKHKPVVSYDYDELDEPMHNGTVSIWEMCAGLLGNVFFTLPLTKNANGQYVPTTLTTTSYSPYSSSTTPNLTALEDFIQQISRDAFDVSPFYRHYAMVHLASDSASCPDYSALHEQDASSTFSFQQSTLFTHNQSSSSSLNVTRKGIKYGLLGAAARVRCFCGFNISQDQVQQACILPQVIYDYILTRDLPKTPDMHFLKVNIASIQKGRFYLHQNERVQRTLREIWQAGVWPCPELDPSDHWGLGILTSNATAWIIGTEEDTSIHLDHLLEVGAIGGPFRPGTIGNILEQAKIRITPRDRIGTMNPSDGSPITGHTKCQMNKPTMRPESLASHFINDLFPAAQGIVDSPAVSHCMRYAIELARKNVIDLINNNNQSRANSQVVDSWKQKCSAQIGLLGICVMTNALDARDGILSTLPTHCAFRLNNGAYKTQDGYITPGCLVYAYSTKKVYDPCQGYDGICSDPGLPHNLDVLNDIVSNHATLLRFNPIDMVHPLDSIRGQWSLSNPQNITQLDYNALIQKVTLAWHDDLTKDLPSRLADTSLFRRSLINEERSGVGSPNTGPNYGPNIGQPLKTATEMPGTQGNTRHCDMIVVRLSLFIHPFTNHSLLTHRRTQPCPPSQPASTAPS